jgi:pseudaminic acid biosynthesis-associated methylase
VSVRNRADAGTSPDAARLEALWSGEFGDAYTERNTAAGDERRRFWRATLEEFPVARVLEVGCNLGANLRWIASEGASGAICGVDVNLLALGRLHRAVPTARPVGAAALGLPFADRAFDMVFTVGVLIHQPPAALPAVMTEIVRCSRRFVMCGEYYAPEPTEVAYRGQTGALFKRDFGGLYRQLFPGLALRKQQFLSKAEGWDDVTFWMFEKVGG